MIDYKTIKVGDRVKVVGTGAPGFASLGDELEIVEVGKNQITAKRQDGDTACFAFACGAARLELIPKRDATNESTTSEFESMTQQKADMIAKQEAAKDVQIRMLQSELQASREIGRKIQREYDAIRQDIPPTVWSVLTELTRAVDKFPTWPTDPMHALAVLGEEFGELTKAVVQQVYEPHKNTHESVRIEAVQTAAIALRFLTSIPLYRFDACEQHVQPRD